MRAKPLVRSSRSRPSRWRLSCSSRLSARRSIASRSRWERRFLSTWSYAVRASSSDSTWYAADSFWNARESSGPNSPTFLRNQASGW